MDEEKRNKLVWHLRHTLEELQKTASERDMMYRSVHAEGEIQSLLMILADCLGDEEIATLLQEIQEAWRKAIAGK